MMVTAALMALGYGPTRRMAGDEGVPAMLAGCAIGFAASLVGTVPVMRARNEPHAASWSAAMVAMAVRMAVAIVLGVALALAGSFPAKPLLLWVVISHAALLVPDTLLSIKVLAQQALVEEK